MGFRCAANPTYETTMHKWPVRSRAAPRLVSLARRGVVRGWRQGGLAKGQPEDHGMPKCQSQPHQHRDDDRKEPWVADSQVGPHGSAEIRGCQNRAEKRRSRDQVEDRDGNFNDAEGFQGAQSALREQN